jgi:hypothetical protein
MEFKKTDSFDYKASASKLEILQLQPRLFAWIDGVGDPNSEAFSGALEALYTYCYAVRMSGKSEVPPAGWFPYVVGVLQGHWTLKEGCTNFDPSRKADLAWTIMIRQPSFLDMPLHASLHEKAIKKARTKGGNAAPWLEKLQLGNREGGRYAQMLHEGPYDNEPATFARMEQQLTEIGEVRDGHHHWELYLTDPRKSAPEKMRTILRVALRS